MGGLVSQTEISLVVGNVFVTAVKATSSFFFLFFFIKRVAFCMLIFHTVLYRILKLFFFRFFFSLTDLHFVKNWILISFLADGACVVFRINACEC